MATALVTAWALRTAIRAIQKKFRTTELRGPKSTSLLFGVSKELFESPDTGAIFEAWSKEYGVAYEIPMIYGQKRVILCDPKAVSYLFSRDTRSYVGTPGHKASVVQINQQIGKGLLWAEGESHRRQRGSIAPSFNSTAIRKFSPMIHKTVEKLKADWEAKIDASGSESVVFDVHRCLDSFGIAGFSYDFGSLDGKPNSMISVLDAFGAPSTPNIWDNFFHLLSLFFPVVLNVPTLRGKMVAKLNARTSEICDAIIDITTKERDRRSNEQVSTISLLLKAEDEDSGQRLTREEILAQMRVLLIASYETTAITMTWALLELARHPNIQTKLREELLKLRVHPASQDRVRQANDNDVIPLSEPVQTKSGEVVDSITIERGTVIGISVPCMNCSEAIWGLDAKVFRPERWLDADGITKKAQEMKGYRHLLTFSDGPRNFLTERNRTLQMVLSVVIKNFVLEMRDGPDTKIELARGIVLRPKVAGEDGIKVPLRVT
ncbi:cytochrome P450 [Pisolithus marmoratus]|nr:cytochrome P450 [Pisolithus marmoratus]